MTAEGFYSTWDTPLVRLPADARSTDVSARDQNFLSRVGLPARLILGKRELPSHVSFEAITRVLMTVRDALPPSVPVPREWDEHRILGTEWNEGGSAPFWCLHGPSGRVELLDVELDDDRPRLINTNLQALARALMALRSWVRDPAPARVRDVLASADPVAWPTSRWKHFAEYIETIPPHDVVCEHDTRVRASPLGPLLH